MLIIMSVLGAVVMPHNLFLHSEVIQSHEYICYACSTQATISGRENSTIALTNSYNHAQYDGCFWIDRMWEEEWNEKKSRRNTLKIARVRITPWQSLVAVASLGWWVPMYLEWELNGDKK